MTSAWYCSQVYRIMELCKLELGAIYNNRTMPCKFFPVTLHFNINHACMLSCLRICVSTSENTSDVLCIVLTRSIGIICIDTVYTALYNVFAMFSVVFRKIFKGVKTEFLVVSYILFTLVHSSGPARLGAYQLCLHCASYRAVPR